MKIDLHIHSNCSDGKMSPQDIFIEADKRGVKFISITDHDSIDCQESAKTLAAEHGIGYLTGLELNISFSHPRFRQGKAVSLDLLGYQIDVTHSPLVKKLTALRDFRKIRAEKILEKINEEFIKEDRELFTENDLVAIESTVDGAFGRPHIANYMVAKKIVATRQEAFDRYLVKCNVPKMPVSLSEASELIRGAGGKVFLAHPADPNGTSLMALTEEVNEQLKIIKEEMILFLDGIECWHSRHEQKTRDAYISFAKKNGLMISGGSDCHQNPVILGSLDIPADVIRQFGLKVEGV
jgi:predicted metal-dependent phosphoesterase TrpH